MNTTKISPLSSELNSRLTAVGRACYFGRAYAAPIAADVLRANSAYSWINKVGELHAAAYNHAVAAMGADGSRANLRTESAVYAAYDRLISMVYDGATPAHHNPDDIAAIVAVVGHMATVNNDDYKAAAAVLRDAKKALKENESPARIDELRAAVDDAKNALDSVARVEFAHYKSFTAVSAAAFRKAVENIIGERLDPAAAPAPTLEEIRAARKARRDAKKAAARDAKKAAAAESAAAAVSVARAAEHAAELESVAREKAAAAIAEMHAESDAAAELESAARAAERVAKIAIEKNRPDAAARATERAAARRAAAESARESAAAIKAATIDTPTAIPTAAARAFSASVANDKRITAVNDAAARLESAARAAAPAPVVVAFNDGIDLDENGVKHIYIG